MRKKLIRIVDFILIFIFTVLSNRVYALDEEKNTVGQSEINIVDFNSINKKEACLKKPEAGSGIKVVSKNKSLSIIDEKDGWYLVNIEGNLYLISSKDCEKNGEGQVVTKNKIFLYEGKEICTLKKDMPLEEVESNKAFIKVKTKDGFIGWVNKDSVNKDKKVVYAKEEVKVYYSMEFMAMDVVKSLKEGEKITKVDEREGDYLLEYEGKMAWVNKAKLSVRDGNIYLKQNERIYEAGIDYTYSAGEKINIVDGRKKDFIKVRTPKGNLAWINRKDIAYDGNRNLVSSKNTNAYFSGNQEINTVNIKGNTLADTAFKEVGYKEGEGNKTKYGDWYGLNAEWCGIFVSWCSNASGISQDVIPKSSYCKESAEWFINHKNWYSKDQYTPRKGDIAYFIVNGDINHIGIVYEVTKDSVITIEGNMSDSVLKVTHKVDDKNIAGYASPLF